MTFAVLAAPLSWWRSRGTSVATIDNTGLVTAIDQGTTTITATSTTNPAKSGSAELSVVHPLDGRSVPYYLDYHDATFVGSAQAALEAAVGAYGLDLTFATNGDFVSLLAAGLSSSTLLLSNAIW